MEKLVSPEHLFVKSSGSRFQNLSDARSSASSCDLWITDPPYADAVNYEELSEFFLAWYKPHLQACFPDWYTDSKRDQAVKGDDSPFRVAMAECYSFLLKSLELEAGGFGKIGAFQDLGRAYGIGDYEGLLGPVKANETRSKLPTEFPRPDQTRWDDLPVAERSRFEHSVTRHLYYAIRLLSEGAEAERAVKHLVHSTNFWPDRHNKHLVLLAYLYQTTEPNDYWTDLRPLLQTLRLAVENYRA